MAVLSDLTTQYVAAAPVYVAAAPVYVAEAPVYVAAAPVYVAAAPVFVAAAPPTHPSWKWIVTQQQLVRSYPNFKFGEDRTSTC